MVSIRLKNRFGPEFIILLIFIISVAGFEIMEYSTYQDLPGPIYGGDIYFHYTKTKQLARFEPFWEDRYFQGEYSYYPWLVPMIIAYLGIITGLGALKMSIWFPILISIGMGLTGFYLGKRYFKNELMGLALGSLLVSFRIPFSTPSMVATSLGVAIFTYFVTFTKTTRGKILAGIIWGLLSLSHVTLFLGGGLYIIFKHILIFFSKHLQLGIKTKIVGINKIKKTIIESLKEIGIFFGCGVPISLLFWAPLIFVYHGKTLNPWHEYTSLGIQRANLMFAWNMIKGSLFKFTGVHIVLSILIIISIVMIITMKRKGVGILLVMTSIAGALHPLITKPLLNMSFGYYRFSLFMPFAEVFLAVTGIYFLYYIIKKYFPDFRYLRITFIILIILLSGFNLNATIKAYNTDRWMQSAKNQDPLTQALFELDKYMQDNSKKDDVILTTYGETSFAIAAATGRKVVHSRRTHSSLFVDNSKRIADASVILYGNNDDLIARLTNEYNVNFFVQDIYSMQSSQNCKQALDTLLSGQAADPISCLVVKPDYAEYLKENGVRTIPVRVRLDPASAEALVYDMLAIYPSNFSNYLTNHISEPTQVSAQGQALIRIYKLQV